jgi:hypothetical protein
VSGDRQKRRVVTSPHDHLEAFAFEIEAREQSADVSGVCDDGSARVSLSSCLRAEPEMMFTDNETNYARLYGRACGPAKDAFHEALCGRRGADALARQPRGTKFAFHLQLQVPANSSVVVRLRLSAIDKNTRAVDDDRFVQFDDVFARRIAEHDAFYRRRIPSSLSADEALVARTAYAGLLWSKQFYHYVVEEWLTGDAAFPPPPQSRRNGRNHDWNHFHAKDVLLMPDKWEYPVRVVMTCVLPLLLFDCCIVVACCVGSGVPLCCRGARRSRAGKAAAVAVLARVVHASQRMSASV